MRAHRPTRLTRRAALAALAGSALAAGLGGCGGGAAGGPATVAGTSGPTLTAGQQSALGARLFAGAIDATGGAYRNPAAQAALRSVAEPLFAAMPDPPLGWEIVLIDGERPSAWSLPGGKIAVNKGLIRIADGESALAAAIAHEMGHTAQGHALAVLAGPEGAQRLDPAARAELAAFDAPAGDIDALARMLARPLLTLALSGYGPGRERAADRTIFTVFAHSGHQPAAAARLLRALAALAAEDAPTTSLMTGVADTHNRADSLDAAAAFSPLARRMPDGAAFATLRSAFPPRLPMQDDLA